MKNIIYRLSHDFSQANKELWTLAGIGDADCVGTCRFLEEYRPDQWLTIQHLAKDSEFELASYIRIQNHSRVDNHLVPSWVNRDLLIERQLYPASLISNRYLVAFEVFPEHIYVQMVLNLRWDSKSTMGGLAFKKWLAFISAHFPDKAIKLTPINDEFYKGPKREKLERFYERLGFERSGLNPNLDHAHYFVRPPIISSNRNVCSFG